MNLIIKGLKETTNNLNRIQNGIGSEKPMARATQLVTREARKNTPVDRGETRASILPAVTSRGGEVVGVVGSKLKSALWAEKGTRPHWPPIKALEPWARRHGMIAFLVARAIARRGTKAHHMLERALGDNMKKIVQEFQDYYNGLVK